MEIHEVLAKNVESLMTAAGMTENAFAAHIKVPKSNFRKMRLQEADMRIGTIAEIAKQLKLRACDLLDPALAQRVANREPLGMSEPRPPVMSEDQWRALSPRARAFVEELCLQATSGNVTDADIAWLHDSLNRASNTRRPAAETSAFAGKPPPAPEPGAPPRKTGDFFHT